MDGCSRDADGQRPAVRAARWLQAPSRQGARLRGGRAYREISTLLLRVARAHCILKQLAWPRAAWRSAQGCLPSSTPPGATRLLSHLLAAFWNAGHTWKPDFAWLPLVWKPKNVAQKRLWIRLNDSHPSRHFWNVSPSPWEVLGCMGEQKVMKWMVNLSWCQLSSNFEWNLPFSSRNNFTFSLETTERILLLFPGTEVFWYPKKLSGQTLRGCSLHLKDFNQRIVLWPQLWAFKLGAVPSRKGWQDQGCEKERMELCLHLGRCTNELLDLINETLSLIQHRVNLTISFPVYWPANWWTWLFWGKGVQLGTPKMGDWEGLIGLNQSASTLNPEANTKKQIKSDKMGNQWYK